MTSDSPRPGHQSPAARPHRPARWGWAAVYVIGLLSCLSILVDFVRDSSWGQAALVLIPIGVFMHVLYLEVRDQRRTAESAR